MYRILTSLAAITALPLLVGSTSTPDFSEETRLQQGNKARIAVTEMTSKTGDCSGVMASAIGDMLSSSLVNKGCGYLNWSSMLLKRSSTS